MSTTTAISRHGSERVTEGIRVVVEPTYLRRQSSPDRGQWVFEYRVTIRNEGTARVRLATRHWRIIDADGEERSVDGPGVVGEHPELGPGDSHEYSSFCPMLTSWGTMEGHFVFERDGAPLKVEVGRFFLVAGPT